jgi:hypothetical protein
MKLLILAAGIGSRFGGVKQMAQVGPQGETLLEYNLYDAGKAGFDEVVFLIRKEMEEDFRAAVLSRLPEGLKISLAFQSPGNFIPSSMADKIAMEGRKKPWGTGHALLCARSALGNGPFAVINADDYYGRQGFEAVGRYLASRYDKGMRSNVALLCCAGYRLGGVVPPKGIVSRAVCSTHEDGSLDKIIEHLEVSWTEGRLLSRYGGDKAAPMELSCELLASMNLWGLDETVFPWLERFFEDFLQDADNRIKGEFFLPVAMGEIAKAKAARFQVLPVSEEYFGLTNPEDIMHVREALMRRVGRKDYPSPLWRGEIG